MKEFERLEKCLEAVRRKTDFVPDVALVLGSGLGGFASQVECETEVSYSEIGGFPRSTVEGHKGRFLFGRVNGVKTVVMDGRVHYYEG
jgi:purine-nucleoside phosphorylase